MTTKQSGFSHITIAMILGAALLITGVYFGVVKNNIPPVTDGDNPIYNAFIINHF